MKKLYKLLIALVSCIFVITAATSVAGCGLFNEAVTPPSNEEELPSDKDDELNGGDNNEDGDNVGGGEDNDNDEEDEGNGNGKPDKPSFTPHESAAGIPDRLTEENEKIVRFSQGASSEFIWADGYSNGDMFNCTWRKNSAAVKNGIMSMSVSKEGSGYAGAEYRSKGKYSYGFYSVCMKPAKCSGVVSSFFTYTNEPVWDEIDI